VRGPGIGPRTRGRVSRGLGSRSGTPSTRGRWSGRRAIAKVRRRPRGGQGAEGGREIASTRARLTDYLSAGRFSAGRHNRRSLLNAARFAATHPRGAVVMARKGIARTLERDQRRSRDVQAARAWIAESAKDPAAVAAAIAPELWEEAGEFAAALDARAKPILAEIPYKLHGGADHRFLYWLTRLTKPKVVVETGVCAGWTSQTFLAAM